MLLTNVSLGGKSGMQISIQGNLIHSISDSAVDFSAAVVDCKGYTIVPGYIDLQLYGGGTYVFDNELTTASLERISRQHLMYGTTSFLITLPSTSIKHIKVAVDIVKAAMEEGNTGVIGLHLEGPFLHPARLGAHNIEHLRKPDIDLVKDLVQLGQGVVKMWTIAPELFSSELLEFLGSQELLISAGHSNASYEEALGAFKKGVRCCTHLFNAMAPLGSREPGLVGACLGYDHVWATVIADGKHISFETLHLALKLKPEKLILISDATFLDVERQQMNIGGIEVRKRGREFYTVDGRLAGSSIALHEAVKNMVTHLNVPLEIAVDMATSRPALLINRSDLGSIAPGKKANLLLLDADLSIKGIMQNGAWELAPI
ncbi:MAG TPA: N-acetylglucosamine-6-phosphate deacetylase [Cytophagales bacterium]|nr:N-acetylglucosamine-6-phosphate deacetylase [Cytophagales bacterium]